MTRTSSSAPLQIKQRTRKNNAKKPFAVAKGFLGFKRLALSALIVVLTVLSVILTIIVALIVVLTIVIALTIVTLIVVLTIVVLIVVLLVLILVIHHFSPSMDLTIVCLTFSKSYMIF